MSWKLTPNTDSIDIEQKSLGISPRRSTIPRDVADYIHENRGLHIQIRHNGNKQAFQQAVELQKLICAAPELLEALSECVSSLASEIAGEYEGTSLLEARMKELDPYRKLLKKFKTK